MRECNKIQDVLYKITKLTPTFSITETVTKFAVGLTDSPFRKTDNAKLSQKSPFQFSKKSNGKLKLNTLYIKSLFQSASTACRRGPGLSHANRQHAIKHVPLQIEQIAAAKHEQKSNWSGRCECNETAQLGKVRSEQEIDMNKQGALYLNLCISPPGMMSCFDIV